MLGLLTREARGGPRRNLGLGGGHRRQTLLATLQFRRDAYPVRDLGAVSVLGQRQQCLDLGPQVRLQGLGMPIG